MSSRDLGGDPDACLLEVPDEGICKVPDEGIFNVLDEDICKVLDESASLSVAATVTHSLIDSGPAPRGLRVFISFSKNVGGLVPLFR